MKKITFFLLLFATMLFVNSCSNDDNSIDSTISNGNSSTINPPAWIIGKWKLQADYNQYYTFTSNDIIMQSAGQSTNIKTLADLGAYSQTSSDNEFTFTTSMPNLSQTYKFKKVSATKILTDFGLGGGFDGVLIKQ